MPSAPGMGAPGAASLPRPASPLAAVGQKTGALPQTMSLGMNK